MLQPKYVMDIWQIGYFVTVINMNIFKNKKGFSLMEVIVSLYVITMALVGILSLVIQNSKTRNINTNYIIASQLSQEGMEIVRSKRDTNWLRDEDWRTGGAPGTDVDIIQDGDYGVDFSGTIFGAMDTIDDSKLFLDVNEMYSHDPTGDPSRFSRLVRILDTNASSTQVECEVRWLDGGQSYNYLTETILFYWP